jgi:hypothetical protein
MPHPRGRRGQIAPPSLLVFPSLFLLVFLLVEIGRLSREKIRSQFALDASATVETEQYSDLLNRMAYINGAFPDRIFKEAYGPIWGEKFSAGLFPGTYQTPGPGDEQWNIRFGEGRAYANVPDPPVNFGYLHMAPEGTGALQLDKATQIAADYISVYQWLGRVAAAQKMMFERIVEKSHPFMRRSLFMNLAGPGNLPGCGSVETCGNEPVSSFRNLHIRTHFIQGFKHCPVVVTIGGESYVGELKGAFVFQGSGLFQLQTVPQADLDMLKRGWLVRQHWVPPKNSYGVDFRGLVPGDGSGNPYPFVRAWVSVSGGKVWPDPMPRFQARLNP